MKKLLLISFDLIREGESEKSLAISSILSYLKKDEKYGDAFFTYHLSINALKLNKNTSASDLKPRLTGLNFHDMDYIALSAYIWNEFLTNDLMFFIRKEFGFKGRFILGGYQISYSNSPESEYPSADYFINGYAEKSLLDVLKGTTVANRLNSTVDFSEIPSPYLSGDLPVMQGQKMVRFETKRGCPYQCTFCAHRDLTYNKVFHHQSDKIYEEIAFFKDNNVGKINILDPIFNAGKEYQLVMDEFIRTDTKSLISVQARFETIHGEKGKEFLDKCGQLNMNLEFGLQTAVRKESELIKRKNQPEKIREVMLKLKNRAINYEVSLIYGLPGQTLNSFKYSIDFLQENGCTNITAFPLMLLKGTKLFQEKEKYNFQERKMGEYDIPVVVSSNSFSEKEWYEMESIANELQENIRI